MLRKMLATFYFLSHYNTLIYSSLAVALTIHGNSFTGTLEPLCEVRDQRRIENDFEIYLMYLFSDCASEPPKVQCSCCDLCYP